MVALRRVHQNYEGVEGDLLQIRVDTYLRGTNDAFALTGYTAVSKMRDQDGAVAATATMTIPYLVTNSLLAEFLLPVPGVYDYDIVVMTGGGLNPVTVKRGTISVLQKFSS